MGKVYLTLDTLLKARGVSRYALAKKTGISYPVIDNYYKNKVVRYDRYFLARICKALGCSIADIIKYEEEGGESECS